MTQQRPDWNRLAQRRLDEIEGSQGSVRAATVKGVADHIAAKLGFDVVSYVVVLESEQFVATLAGPAAGPAPGGAE